MKERMVCHITGFFITIIILGISAIITDLVISHKVVNLPPVGIAWLIGVFGGAATADLVNKLCQRERK